MSILILCSNQTVAGLKFNDISHRCKVCCCSNQTVAGLKSNNYVSTGYLMMSSNQTVAGLKSFYKYLDVARTSGSNQTVAGLKCVIRTKISPYKQCSNQTVAGLKFDIDPNQDADEPKFKSDRCGIEMHQSFSFFRFLFQSSNQTVAGLKSAMLYVIAKREQSSNQTVAGLKCITKSISGFGGGVFKSDRCGIEIMVKLCIPIGIY